MGVTHLLDTHTFLWLVGEPAEVAAPVREELGDPAARLGVSAASAWEAATKQRLGRLGIPQLVATWTERVADLGAQDLPVETEDALMAGSLAWEHRDPFDRLLVAQGIRRNAVLVTVDRAILALPGLRTLTW